MTKSSIGVVGIGEVGLSIFEILEKKFDKVLKKDLNYDEISGNKIDYLHICIPYNKKFEEIVVKEVKAIKPKLVIIHSTIQFGITRKIFKKTGIPIAHSPVRRIHPRLTEDIKISVKYVGGVDEKSTKLAVKHLKEAGLKVYAMDSCEETELAKLLDTTYYGWNILYCKFVSKMCKELKLDFENVYSHFNHSYNEGYKKSKPNVRRPVLVDMPGPIGGHCVVSNVDILSQKFNEPFINFFLKENAKLKNPKTKNK